jgi:hypothetical protein
MPLSSERKALHRKAIMGGGIFGGVLSVVISVLMDFLASDSMQGTWRDAIANDLDRFMSVSISPDSLTAYALFVVVMLFLAAVGAGIGAFFAYIVFKVLELLSS